MFTKLAKSIPYFILVLIYIAMYFYIDWKYILQTITNSHTGALIFVMSLSFLYPFIGARRWGSVVDALGVTATSKDLLRSTMMAFAANIFLPAKSGDFLKAFFLGPSVNKLHLASGVIAERLGDLLALAILILLGSCLGNYFYASVCALAAIVLFLAIVRMRKRLFGGKFHGKVVGTAINSLNLFADHSAKMYVAIGWSLSNWFVGVVQVFCLFRAFGVELEFMEVIFRFPLTVLVSIVPVTPGGLGLRESAYVFMFGSNWDANVAFLVGASYYLVSTVALSLAGFFFVTRYIDRKVFQTK